VLSTNKHLLIVLSLKEILLYIKKSGKTFTIVNSLMTFHPTRIRT